MKTKPISKKMWKTVRQSLIIIFLAAVTGLLTNHGRSDRLPLVAGGSPEARLTTDTGASMIVSLNEARRLCLDDEAVFLDARSPEEYARGHIRCAQNIPWQSFDAWLDRVWGVIPEDARIITYCDGEECSLSADLARELISLGYQDVRVLVNGWTRWKEAGFPTDGVRHGLPNKE